MKSPFLSSLLLALSAIAGPAGAAAANVVVNGSFVDGLSGWSRTEGVSWSVTGAGTAGSARITGDLGVVGRDVLLQCVPVQGWTLYDFEASARLPYDPRSAGGLSLRVRWHAGDGCQGQVLRGSPPIDFAVTSSSAWQRRELRRLPSPEEARSALVVLVAWSTGQGDYSAWIDEVSLRLSAEVDVLAVPTAASSGGARGERFQSDLWVKNHAPAARRFALRFACESGDACGTPPVSLLLGPNESRYLRDVLRDYLFQQDGTGAVEIEYDPREGPLSAWSVNATVNADRPGFAAAIPALPRDAARTRGVFLGLSGGSDDPAGLSRVNVGAFNPSPEPATLTFALRDGGGELLGEVTRAVGARSWIQVNDLFGAVGAGDRPTTGAYAEFRSSLPLFPFALRVDNRSGDATYVLPGEDPQIP